MGAEAVILPTRRCVSLADARTGVYGLEMNRIFEVSPGTACMK